MKSESMEIRMKPEEKEAFKKSAELAGISLSSWARERLRLAAIRELERAGQQIPFIKPVSLRRNGDD